MKNEFNPIKSILIENGWREENIDCLPGYSLYRDMEVMLTYQNRLAVQLHSNGNDQNLRYTVSDWGIGVCRTMQGKLTRTVNEDSSAYQFDLNTNSRAIIQYIIDTQDKVTIHNANDYFMFNSPVPSTMLMLEQFLNKEKYLNNSSNSSSWSEGEISAMKKSDAFCQEGQFDNAQEFLLSYLNNNGEMNIFLFYNLLYTCVNAGIQLSTENKHRVIEAGIRYLNSLSKIEDYDRQHIFFISRLTYMMLLQKQYKEIVETIRKYASIGGKIEGDILLNYSHAASCINDSDLIKEVLHEMVKIYNTDFRYFTNRNKNNYIWYLADNIASLSATIDDKQTTLHYLSIARDLDPQFVNNKTDETFIKIHNDPDFLALFHPLSAERILLNKIRNRAMNPETIHDMAEGISPAPEINSPVLLTIIEKAEAKYGFKFPELFKEIYTKIGNGGFGPGYGLYNFSTAQDTYDELIKKGGWQIGKWPLCTWGCAIDSYVDCKDSKFPVYHSGNSSSDDCCNNPVTFTFTDANGNVSTGKGGSIMSVLNQIDGKGDLASKSNNINGKNGSLVFHKASFSEWMSDWTQGVNLWYEMSNESEDDEGFNEAAIESVSFSDIQMNENPDAQGDDPEIFPGSPVSRLSDYVKIIKGMQSGNMGVLAEYGLDMMQYATISQAWAPKLADPKISMKFSEMMAQ